MTDQARPSVTFTLTEPAETPWLGVFFGHIAMVPFALGALTFALAPEPWRGAALLVTLFWGCAILCFLVVRPKRMIHPFGQVGPQNLSWCIDSAHSEGEPSECVDALAGVRRGVSFRTPGGTTAAQIVTVLWLFCLGFAAVVLTAVGLTVASTVALILGYISLEVFDPVAARKLEAPLSFARLRPARWRSRSSASSPRSCYC